MLEKPGEYAAVLTPIGIRAKMAMPVVVPSKSVSQVGLTELKRFIIEAGRTTVYLQSDRESLVKARVDSIVKEIPGLHCRWALTGSSASQGSVARHLQILYAH